MCFTESNLFTVGYSWWWVCITLVCKLAWQWLLNSVNWQENATIIHLLIVIGTTRIRQYVTGHVGGGEGGWQVWGWGRWGNRKTRLHMAVWVAVRLDCMLELSSCEEQVHEGTTVRCLDNCFRLHENNPAETKEGVPRLLTDIPWTRPWCPWRPARGLSHISLHIYRFPEGRRIVGTRQRWTEQCGDTRWNRG